MPLLSFYLIVPRFRGLWRRFHLFSINDYPDDWLHLKDFLIQAMEQVHHEHDNMTEALTSLERHLPGRSFVKHGASYRPEKIPYRREYEAIFNLVYNPHTRDLTVKSASFGYKLSHVREDFWRVERGIRWRSPPLIPREYQNIIGDPDALLREWPSGTRYADYSRRPHNLYGLLNEKNLRMQYQRKPVETYSQKPKQLRERPRR
jgi:hypothetical protein